MESLKGKYDLIIETLDDWNVNQADLLSLRRGDITLNKNGIIAWTHLAYAFNQEIYPLIAENKKNKDGISVIINEPNHEKRLQLLRRSLLYTDHTVVFSGQESLIDYNEILNGVKNGGIICDQIPEFFGDLLELKSMLHSGLGICLQKYYLDSSPDKFRVAWILTDIAKPITNIDRVSRDKEINPYFVYSDYFLPATLDYIYLGSNYQQWKNRLTTSLKSPQELTFATILNFDLPYLDNIPLETIVELRMKEPLLFSRARKAIQAAISECLKFDGSSTDVNDFAHYIQINYLNRVKEDANEDIKIAISKQYVRRSGLLISSLSLVFNVLIGNPVGAILNLMKLGQEGTTEFLDSKSELLRKKGNDLYLFSKLENL